MTQKVGPLVLIHDVGTPLSYSQGIMDIPDISAIYKSAIADHALQFNHVILVERDGAKVLQMPSSGARYIHTSRNLIFAIVCQRCQMLYISETKTALSTRFSDHLRSIRSNLPSRPVAAHFNSNGHTIEHAEITGILSTSGNSDKDRHSSKQRIISKLQTLHPHGINIRFDMMKNNWITI